MCRLAAFPPGMEADIAVHVLSNFARGNSDGTGSVYVKDGKFVVNKAPTGLKSALKNIPLLDHMPYDGWTVVHLRAASHGPVAQKNTHPFVKDNWATVHNGMWSDYKLVKASTEGLVDFEGDTDSEAAAHLLSTVGPKRFYGLVCWGGVFLSLNLKGELWAINTGGDLETIDTKYGMMLASEFPLNWSRCRRRREGWMHLSPEGLAMSEYEVKFKEDKVSEFRSLWV